MASILLWPELALLAQKARRRFRLKAFVLEPIAHPRARVYGDCDIDGTDPARVRLRVHKLHGKGPLARSTIFDSLAHELAHLQFPNHGPEWKLLKAEILTYFKENN